MKNISCKVCRENQKNILYSITFFFRKSCLFEIMCKNIVEPDRPQMTIWRMRFLCRIPKVTNSHSEYVIITAFPMQQWLHERTAILCHTYIAFIVLTLSIYWHFFVMHRVSAFPGIFFFVFPFSTRSYNFELFQTKTNMTKEQYVILHSNGVEGIIISCTYACFL
jgi:hypothetical protein